MTRSNGYTELSQLAEDLLDILHRNQEDLQYTTEPLSIGTPYFQETTSTIKNRVDIPIEYNGQKFYLTLRRRNK